MKFMVNMENGSSLCWRKKHGRVFEEALIEKINFSNFKDMFFLGEGGNLMR